MVVLLLCSEKIACVSVLERLGEKVTGWAGSGTDWRTGPGDLSKEWPSNFIELLVKYSCENSTRCDWKDCVSNLLEKLFTCALRAPERCTDIVLRLFISSSCPCSSPFLCSDPIGLEEKTSLSFWCWSGFFSKPARYKHQEYYCVTPPSSIRCLPAFDLDLI